jgi:HK97 family phage major capsid protein
MNPVLTPGLRARLTAAGIEPHRLGGRFNSVAFPGAADTETVDDSVIIPDTAEGLAELASDPKRWAQVTKNGAALVDFIDKVSAARINHHKDIKAQVDDQIDKRWAEFVKQNKEDGFAPVNLAAGSPRGDGIAAANTRNGRAGLYNSQALGARIDSEFKDSAEFFSTIWHNRQHNADGHAKLARVRNAFTSNVPSEGGFLIPETLRSQLLSVSLESAIVRPLSFVVPMETLRVPFPAIDESTHVGSVFGGIVAYWTEEDASLTESSANFGRVVLDAKKLTAMAHVPNELISDSLASFQAFIDQKFPEALTFFEDRAFMKGSGVGEPLGGLNTTGNPAIVAVAAESGQAAGTILWENIVTMYSRMLPSSLGRAVWVVSIDAFPELATMALSVGTGGSAVWLNNGVAGPPMTILGRPVIFTEKAPGTVGNQGDISFVDFGYYLIGDRQVMTATSSPHYRFASDQTSFRIINRVDGQPWLRTPITPENGGPSLSPFIQLATRS